SFPHSASSTGSRPASAGSSAKAHHAPDHPCPPPSALPRATADRSSAPQPPRLPTEPAAPSSPCLGPEQHHPATSRCPYSNPLIQSYESRTHKAARRSRDRAPATPPPQPHPASPASPANQARGSPLPYSA